MIRQVALKNFKAFREQIFPLAKINLLSGLNGSGKSSLIQALLVLRQSADLGLLPLGAIALNGQYTSLGHATDARFESATEDEIGITVQADGDFAALIHFPDPADRVGLITPIANFSESIGCLFNKRFCFLAAERGGPRVHYGVPDADVPSAGLGVKGEWTINFLTNLPETAHVLEPLAHPAALSLQVRHQAEAWMREISPGIQFHLSDESALDLVSISYSFVTEKDTSSRYRSTNVGFGISYVLPVICACLIARPGDLLIVESPEAHLHPRGQGKISELLCRAAAAGVQVIVESHSDHVMNGIRVSVHDGLLESEDVNFFYFQWTSHVSMGTSVERIKLDKQGRLSGWPKGFFDEFDHSLEILLTPKPLDA